MAWPILGTPFLLISQVSAWLGSKFRSLGQERDERIDHLVLLYMFTY